MAHAITFDKLAYFKRLEQAGVQHEQAEAFAEALGDALKEGSSELATKGDIRELKGEIQNIEKRITQLQWMMGITVVGVISLIMKAFF